MNSITPRSNASQGQIEINLPGALERGFAKRFEKIFEIIFGVVGQRQTRKKNPFFALTCCYLATISIVVVIRDI
jgi:hypothetical protein